MVGASAPTLLLFAANARTLPNGSPAWYADPDWWVAGFTAALFVATTGLWAFTGMLWWSTRRAVIEGQRGVQAATLQAQAAINSERPFVYVNNIELVHRSDDTIYFVIEFRNYGKTPAFIMDIKTDSSISEILPSEPTYSGLGFAEFIMGSGDAHKHIPISFTKISTEQMRLIKRNKLLYFCWGKIVYRDFMRGITDIGFCVAYDFGIKTVEGKILQPPGFFNPIDPLIGIYRYERYVPAA